MKWFEKKYLFTLFFSLISDHTETSIETFSWSFYYENS